MRKNTKIMFISLIFLIALILMCMMNIDGFWEDKQEKSTNSIEEAVRKTSLECYALEGSFPPSIEYLKDNYGLIVNNDAYFYHYQANGSNMPPDIRVIKKWKYE